MEHQDWNSIKFNTPSQNAKKELEKKVNSNKPSSNEDVVMESPKQLGQLIAQARTTIGKNQKELASNIGVSSQILGRWESNKELPNNAQIALIEKTLKVKLPRLKKVKKVEA